MEVVEGASSYSLMPGSVAVLMPGKTFSPKTNKIPSCEYLCDEISQQTRGGYRKREKAGGSIIKDWNAITFRAHDKSGIPNYFERPTAMMKRLEMHVTYTISF